MTSRAGLRASLEWRDNTGQPIFVPNGSVTAGAATSAGPAGTLFGYPVWVNSDIPAPGSAVIGWYFGDLSRYQIADVGGLRVDASSEFCYGSDQYSIRVIREVAGELPDVTGIAYMVAADT